MLLNPFDTYIIILECAILLQLILFFVVFSRFAFYKRKVINNNTLLPKVSVILTAKNEDENLAVNLPLMLEQDYPVFEVIVVNDQSVDNTQKVLETLERKYTKLVVIKIEDFINDHVGKKFALTLAIKKARFDTLLFTDADCKPVSDQWIRLMARNFTDEKQFVLGFSPYEKKKSLLNLFIQFDTCYTALLYFSYALMRKPYMGVGRNMSYKKGLFFEHGFSPFLHIYSGDDDLFVNVHANDYNVAIEADPESFMLSVPKTTWHQWARQKKRHLSTGKEYKKGDKYRLGFTWLTQLIFWLTFAAAMIFVPQYYIFILSLLGFRLLFTLFVYGNALKRMKRMYLIPFIPFIEIFYHLLLIPYWNLGSKKRMKKNVW